MRAPGRHDALAMTIVVALLACPLVSGTAWAQPDAGAVRIGYLSPVSATADATNREAFVGAMRSLGYIDGRNAHYHMRYADGEPARLPALAAELRLLKVDILVAATTTAVRVAQQSAPATPIVMAFAGDPVGDGLVASLARPGGLTTGLSAAVSEIAAKRVEVLKAVVPKATHFVLLAAPAASTSMVSASERAGTALGVRITTIRIAEPGDVARAFAEMRKTHVDGLIVDLALRRSTSEIVESAQAQRLPTISGPREFAVDGGLLALGADYAELYRGAATFVDKILRGGRPADLPVEQSSKFKLVVNAGTAKALGLSLPDAVRTSADEVIR